MRLNNLLSKVRKRLFKLLKGIKHKKMDDLININFKSNQPNCKWYTDITMIKCRESRLNLSVIIDGYNNEIIAHRMGERPNFALVLDTVHHTCHHHKYNDLIPHSDQGSTYTAYSFQNYLKEKNNKQSMSRVGICFDNVQIESFFSHLKDEIFYSPNQLEPKQVSVEKANEYLYYYNNNRIQIKLKEMSPVQYRVDFAI